MWRTITVIVLFSSLFLGACSSGKIKDDIVIEQTKNNELQMDIINSLTNQSAHWLITIHEETIENIKVTVDHYNKGEKQEPLLELSTMIERQQKPYEMQLIVAEQVFQEDNTKWIAAFIEDGSTSSIETFSSITNDTLARAYSSIPVPATAKKGEKIIIGAIVYTDNHKPISTSIVFDQEVDEQQLKDYKHVLIISLETNSFSY